MTDAEGRYEFRDLPAGRFNIRRRRPGYVTIQYGQTRPFESGKALDLADGQVMDKADISMPRGSAISGRISRRVRRSDRGREGQRDAIDVVRRASGGCSRPAARADQRSRPVPDLRPVAGRLLRQRDVPRRRGNGGHGNGDRDVDGEAAAAPAGRPDRIPTRGTRRPTSPARSTARDAQKITLAVGQEAQSTDFALLPVRSQDQPARSSRLRASRWTGR